MAEESFKTLKLTTLKAAKPARASESQAEGLSGPANEPASADSLSPSVAPSPPAAVSPAAASATTETPALKAFKYVASPTPPAAEPVASASIVASEPVSPPASHVASFGSSPSFAMSSTDAPRESEPVREALSPLTVKASPAAKVSVAPLKSPAPAEASANKARSSKKVVPVAILATILLLGAALAVSGVFDDAPKVKPLPPVPEPKPEVAPPQKKPPSPASTPAAPVAGGESVAVPASTPVAAPAAPAAISPMNRKPATVAWLNAAVLSVASTQRITLNDKAYALGAVVAPEHSLVWIGRDSITNNLLFMDGDGVIYEKSTISSIR